MNYYKVDLTKENVSKTNLENIFFTEGLTLVSIRKIKKTPPETGLNGSFSFLNTLSRK